MKLRLPLLFAAAAMGASLVATAPAYATDYTVMGAFKETSGKLTWDGGEDPKEGENNASNKFIFSGATTGYFPGWNGGTFQAAVEIASGESITLKDGQTNGSNKFTGAFTGSGNLAISSDSTQAKSTAYIFQGNMTGFSGNIDASAQDNGSICFGAKTGESAIAYASATATSGVISNISGTGSISAGNILTYNYAASTNNGYTTLEIDNSTISAKTLNFQGSANYDVKGAVSGKTGTASTLTVSGTGTTKFSGAVSGFGTITLSAGTTEFASTLGATSIVVSGDSIAKFSGTAPLTGAVSTTSNLTVAVADAGVTLTGILKISPDIISSSTALLSSSKNISLGEGTKLRFLGTFTDGTYKIFSTTGSATLPSLESVKVSPSGKRFQVNLSTSGNDLLANVKCELKDITWNGGAEAKEWNYDNDDWKDSSGKAESYTNGDSITFASSANLTLAMDVTPASITVKDQAKVEISGSGENIITGATKIDVSLNSVLTLSGAHDFTGATTVAAGSKLVWNIDNDNFTIGTVISGAGDFEKAGAGTLVIDGAKLTTSRIGVSGGTLKMATFREGNYFASGNGVLEIAAAGTFTDQSSFSGNGTIRVSATEATVFATPASVGGNFSGTVEVAGGNVTWGRGNTNAATAGQTRKFGDKIVVESGKTLKLHLWTTSKLTTSTSDKVNVATQIVLKDSTLTIEDGSYYFSKGITVSGSGTSNFGCVYAKGFVINGLYGDENTNDSSVFVMNRGNSDANESQTVYGLTGEGTYNGTIKITTNHGGAVSTLNLLSEKAAQKAVIELTDTAKTRLNVATSATVGGLAGTAGTVTGAASATLTLDVKEGRSVSYGGTFQSLSLVKTGAGTQTFTGTAQATSVAVSAGTLTFESVLGATNAGGSITVSDGTLNLKNGSNLTGTLRISGGAVNVTAGKTIASSNISVSSGTLDLGGYTALAGESVTVSLGDGAIKNLGIGGGQVLVADVAGKGEVENFKIQGGTVKLTGENSFVSVKGNFAIDATGEAQAAIDFSDVLFTSSGTKQNVFVYEGTTLTEEFLNSLNSMKLVGAEGEFTLDTTTTSGKTNVVFTVSGVTVVDWDLTSKDKTWTATSFSGRELGSGQSVRFVSHAGTENVSVVGDVSVGRAILTAGAGTYAIGGSGTVNVAGDVSALSGRVEVGVKMTSGSITVNGGELVGKVAGSLNVKDGGSVVIKTGTLSIENSSALNAKEITLNNGTLAFVSGALNSVENQKLKVDSFGGRATIKWLAGNTNDISSKLKLENGSTLVLDTNGNDVTFAASTELGSSDYVKTGAGTLILSAGNIMQGDMLVESGTLQLNNQGNAAITGTITIADGGTLSANTSEAFGNGDQYKVKEVIVQSGGTVSLFGDDAGNQDNQTLKGTKITLMGGKIVGESKSGFDLMENATIETSAESGTSTVSVPLQLRQEDTTFTTGADSRLVLNGNIIDSNSDGTGTHNLKKAGEGTLVISGEATYSGKTEISAGELELRGSKLGNGEVVAESDASLVSAASSATLKSLSGAGSLQVASGTTTFNSLTHKGGTTVDSGATLLLARGPDAGAAEPSYSGVLTLNGTFGGSGTYSGDATLGTGAKLFAGEINNVKETFNFNGTVVSGSAVEKTGAGTVVLSGDFLKNSNPNFAFTVSAGTLSSSADLTATTVKLNGGTLGSSTQNQKGVWTIGALSVFANGSTLAGEAKLASATSENAIVFAGSSATTLTISGKVSSDKAVSLRGNGVLEISGGSLTTKSLVLGDEFSGNKMAIDSNGTLTTGDLTISKDITISGSGTLDVSGTAVFGGAGENKISGTSVKTGANTVFDVAGKLTFEEGAKLADGSATLTKTGAGTLTVGSVDKYTGSVSVQDGTLIFSGYNESNTESVSVSGENSVLRITNTTNTFSKKSGSVSLTNGALLDGSLTFGSKAEDAFTAINSTISGALVVNGGAKVFVSNLNVKSTITIEGASTVVFDGASPALTTERTITWKNGGTIELSNTGTIGTELVLATVGEKNTTTITTGSITLADSVYAAIGREKEDVALKYDSKTGALKLETYGTLVWHDAATWNDSDASWEKTQKDKANLTGQKFVQDDFVAVEFKKTGQSNKIALDKNYNNGVVNLGGLSFKGDAADAVFTVNFADGAGFADQTADNNKISSVSIQSGTVVFAGDFDNTFSGGLFISSGAALNVSGKVDAEHRLGTGAITLGGALTIGANGSELNNSLVVAGTAASISVGEKKSAKINGSVSGSGILTKIGSGTLEIALKSDDTTNPAKMDVSGVVVSAGKLQIAGAGTVSTGSFSVAKGATLGFGTSAVLSKTAATTFANAGTIKFDGDANLYRVNFTADGAKIDVKGAAHFGGKNADDTAVLSGLLGVSAGSASISGNLVFDGAKVGDNKTSLTAAVADGAKLTVSGNVSDGESDKGEFVLVKTGAGDLAIAGKFDSSAEVVLDGGAISVGAGSKMSGDFSATADRGRLTFAVADGNSATLGASGKTLAVGAGRELLLVANGKGGVLDIASNLSVGGNLILRTGNEGASINLSGANNIFNSLQIGENGRAAFVSVAENAGLIGSEVFMYNGSELKVKGSRKYENGLTSGDFFVGDFSKVSFERGTTTGSEDAMIRFNSLNGINSNPARLYVAGAGTLEISGSANATNLTVEIASGSQLALNTSADAHIGAFAGAGTVAKGGAGTWLVDSASAGFKGKAALTVGTTVIQNAFNLAGEIVSTGTLGEATVDVGKDATLQIGVGKAVIGKVVGEIGEGKTAVAGVLTGGNAATGTESAVNGGTVLVAGYGNSLEFLKDGIGSFSGTLVAENYGTIVYNTALHAALTGENQPKILLKTGVLRAEGFSVKTDTTAALNSVSVSLNRISGSSELGIINVAEKSQLEVKELDTSALTVAGTLYFDTEAGANLNITGNLSDKIRLVKIGEGSAKITGGTTANAHLGAEVIKGTLEFVGANSVGAGEIVLRGKKADSATIKFSSFNSANTVANAIDGVGTVELASANVTLSKLSDSFGGYVVSTADGATVEKSNGTLGANAVIYSAKENAKLVIDMSKTGTDSDTVAGSQEISSGAAMFSGAGTVELKIGKENTLTVESASDISGVLAVSEGTLKVASGANLGTAKISLAKDTVLNVRADALVNSVISGDGTLLISRDDAGTSFVAGEIASNVEIKRGKLSLENLASGAPVSMAGGTLLLSQEYDSATNSIVDRTDSRKFEAEFSADAPVLTFEHSANNGSASEVSGTWATSKAPNANTIIKLVGGGNSKDGSQFELDLETGTVVKSGSGKWVVSNVSAAKDMSARVDGGTLALAGYSSNAGWKIEIGSDATFEIAGFVTPNMEIAGAISGSGTLAISDDSGVVTIGEITGAGAQDWNLLLHDGVSLKVAGSFAKDVALNGESTLTFDVGENANYSGIVSMNSGAKIVKDGSGTLTFDNIPNISGTLEINAGTVAAKGLGNALGGEISIAKDASLELAPGKGKTIQLYKILSGEGALKFIDGTTTVGGGNKDFSGSVEIASGATVVFGGLTKESGFGTASIALAGTLEIKSASNNTINAISGSGTLVIGTEKNIVTTYGSGNGNFAGTVKIATGVFEFGTDKLGAINNAKLDLAGVSVEESTLRISNSGAKFALGGGTVAKLGASGKGTIELKGKFGIAGDEFGVSLPKGKEKNVEVKVAKDSALSMASARILGSLNVAQGGTLSLGFDASAPFIASVANSVFANDSTPIYDNSVAGDFTLAGKLETGIPEDGAALNVGGKVEVKSTGHVVVDDSDYILTDGGTFTLFTAGDIGNTKIDSGALFETTSGVQLTGITQDGSVVVALHHDLVFPSGLSGLGELINSNPNSKIFNTIFQSGGTRDEQAAKLRNFSPISFAGALELMSGFAQTEADLLRERLEQRRYDRAFREPADAIKTFANAFGSTSDTSSGKNKAANYDMNHFGAIAGFDGKLSEDFLLGFSLAYDRGTVDVHNGGGKHESSASRVGVYGMQMFNDISYLGFGASVGITSVDTKRTNALETVKGDTDGADFAFSATFGTIFTLSETLHVSPYVGADFSYATLGSFDESGAKESGLDVDSVNRTSLRGIVGATLNWVANDQLRLGLDVAFAHEFCDTDADIDAVFNSGDFKGSSFSSTAYFSGENTLSIGPRVEWRINESWAASASYTFEADFDETISHSANIGVRCRF